MCSSKHRVGFVSRGGGLATGLSGRWLAVAVCRRGLAGEVSPGPIGLRCHATAVVRGFRQSVNSSRDTSARFLAMANSERAARKGFRRPCCHSRKVRADTPSTFANFACESPERIRASSASGTLMQCSREARPDFIWRTAQQLLGNVPTPVSRNQCFLARTGSVIGT